MAMAPKRLSLSLLAFILILLSGLVVSGEIGGTAAAACRVQCFQGGSITCDNYPYQKLDVCDCQCAPKNGINCVLHLLSSGDTFTCPPPHA